MNTNLNRQNPLPSLALVALALWLTAMVAPATAVDLSIPISPDTIEPDDDNLSDDAEEKLSDDSGADKPLGWVGTGSSDLELGQDDANGDPQAIGLRFVDTGIPKGAAIQSAAIQFTAKGIDKNDFDASFIIYGDLSPDAEEFTQVGNPNFSVTGRPRTTAFVEWDVPPWRVDLAFSENERTPDLSAIVQEIIAQPGWASDNAMALMILPPEDALDGTSGVRTAYSADESVRSPFQLGPVLEISFEEGVPLQAGDADQDFDFDQFDLIQVQIAAKYLTGQAATWGQGDWNGAPGGSVGDPPAGDGQFDQLDIIAALNAGKYLTGVYNAIKLGGGAGDGQTSVIYNPTTGELAVDAPLAAELTSINIDSASGIFTGDPAQNLGGSFDNDSDQNIFKATFGSSFGSLSFGNVAQAGLSEELVANDLSVVGSLAGGGDLGEVDLIYVPEPSTIGLLLVAMLLGLRCFRLTH